MFARPKPVFFSFYFWHMFKIFCIIIMLILQATWKATFTICFQCHYLNPDMQLTKCLLDETCICQPKYNSFLVFCCGVVKGSIFLRYQMLSLGNWNLMFQESLVVSSSNLKMFGATQLSQNFTHQPHNYVTPQSRA